MDVTLPFLKDEPKPVVLVGENGSGKTIVLSHIVNGLIMAKDLVYPETPEVETNRVYKLRDNSYIHTDRDFYFSRIDFKDDLYVTEFRTRLLKNQYQDEPIGINESTRDSWDSLKADSNDHQDTTIKKNNEQIIRDTIQKNCVLYFPANRFEEPAWLNERNLTSYADLTESEYIVGYTARKIVNTMVLKENQDWLYGLAYDMQAFEINLLPFGSSSLRLFGGHRGPATDVFNLALRVVREILGDQGYRFGIGFRHSRTVSLMRNDINVVPNIFQLSAGETSLLNLFLSILRDYDATSITFSQPEEIAGIVVVDEIDLHLHSRFQFDVLPKLIKMFPRIQFIVTTHSPLFVLGLRNCLGEEGFSLLRLPSGQSISPEEFGEFESAYQSFAYTERFLSDVSIAIERSQLPVVYVDGDTDVDYLHRAAQLLDQEWILEKLNLHGANGEGNLNKIWEAGRADNFPTQRMVLMYDSENRGLDSNRGNLFRRKIPIQSEHLVEKGIENLFDENTLRKALRHKPAFIDIISESGIRRGVQICAQESWMVNGDEKRNLCDWLCENGTQDDFRHFHSVFEILVETLNLVRE